MNTASWISSQVAKLLPHPAATPHEAGAVNTSRMVAPALDNGSTEAVKVIATQPGTPRSTHERLHGSLTHKGEATSPRELRRLLEGLKSVIDPQVSEVEGGRRALAVASWYASAKPEERRDLWLLMSEQFVADPHTVKLAREAFARAHGTPDEPAAEVTFRRATVSPRRRLLQRFSAYPGGIRFLVDLRAELLPHLKSSKRLQALDVEMEYMFSTWFDVGFLDLRRISWDSPASLIEKLIKYEAVHDIKSWADVKNRLDSDRRCYGFFHPRLPDEPLIFVEVALVDKMADAITPLLDELADAADLNKATTAIFYSISNTQEGLRGVSFGDSLIKRVVEVLKQEFPRLKVFATLSPIPGFRAWLAKNAAAMLARLDDKMRANLGRALNFDPPGSEHFLSAIERAHERAHEHGDAHEGGAVLRKVLLQFAAHYLGTEMVNGKPADPVGRFHLGNGARVERLNWAGDLSAKGLKQSYGLMVNYLYDLRRLDKHRAQLIQGKIAVSSDVQDLLL